MGSPLSPIAPSRRLNAQADHDACTNLRKSVEKFTVIMGALAGALQCPGLTMVTEG